MEQSWKSGRENLGINVEYTKIKTKFLDNTSLNSINSMEQRCNESEQQNVFISV